MQLAAITEEKAPSHDGAMPFLASGAIMLIITFQSSKVRGI
jgi:hypothetical protein